MMHTKKQDCIETFDSASTSPRLPARRNWKTLAGIVVDILLKWQERAFERRALRELDSRLLKDIGVSRADVEKEARKPFWQG